MIRNAADTDVYRSGPSHVHLSADDAFTVDEGANGDLSLSQDTRGIKKWKTRAKGTIQGMCTMRFLRRRLPIVAWLPTYSFSFLSQDLIAGVTVGLTTIPQGIAYAAVAGLPLQVMTSLKRI